MWEFFLVLEQMMDVKILFGIRANDGKPAEKNILSF